MPEEHEKFEVKDRRKALLDDDDTAEEPKAAESVKEEAPKAPPKTEEAAPGPSVGQMPPLDFIAFIGSLGASALMHMGEQLAPDQPRMEVSLPAAQQMIDILDMLKTKTAGNLDKDEQGSLDNLLYNLKMRFTQLANAAK